MSARLVGVIEEEAGVARAGRLVTTIHLDNHGRAAGVTHCAADGSDAQEVRAPVLLGNAAPPVLAEALPSETREAFLERYIGLTPSISLFSIALGLDQRPREFGFTHYSTVLLPDWLGSLADYARSADLLADHPSGRIPVMVAVDYSAIDSGLNPDGPHLVTLVGVDRVANWQELDGDAYDQKREAWLDAIVADVDRTFPGFCHGHSAKRNSDCGDHAALSQHAGGRPLRLCRRAARVPQWCWPRTAIGHGIIKVWE